MPGPATVPAGSVRNMFFVWVTVSTTSIGANSTQQRGFTVPGLRAGFDTVYVNKPSHQAGLGIVNARVGIDDSLSLVFMNCTGAGITPTVEDYFVCVVRHDYPDRNTVPSGIA